MTMDDDKDGETPLELMRWFLHEQRIFGQGDPEKQCTTECREAAMNLMDTLLEKGYTIIPVTAAAARPGREPWVAEAMGASYNRHRDTESFMRLALMRLLDQVAPELIGPPEVSLSRTFTQPMWDAIQQARAALERS